jgi:hypothetical protein
LKSELERKKIQKSSRDGCEIHSAIQTMKITLVLQEIHSSTLINSFGKFQGQM